VDIAKSVVHFRNDFRLGERKNAIFVRKKNNVLHRQPFGEACFTEELTPEETFVVYERSNK
jgi:hypothetical protein